ncbi:MAG: penicillin acylase family protein, partial [Anaerolineae bacterium]|nr:penicillin acylase family protein [Anaerolineae bacterium]
AEMQGWLGEWDFRFTIDSPQAALFAAYWHRLAEFTYGDELGVLLYDCTATRRGITQLLAFANHPWWDDVRTRLVVERRNAIQRKAFEQAITDLGNTLGDNRDEWRWGDLHTVTFGGLSASSLGIDLIESQFDRGPVEVSGSVDTVNAARSQPTSDNRFRVSSAPSARMIVDLGALDLSRAMHTTGQSNHLASEHYDDMIDPWRYIEYHTMLWNRTSIEEAADAMLALEPVYIPAATPTAE